MMLNESFRKMSDTAGIRPLHHIDTVGTHRLHIEALTFLIYVKNLNNVHFSFKSNLKFLLDTL